MLIDPFTTVAQIINFLILVAILKRFLYKPIMQAMEQREKRINMRLEDAAQQLKLAEQETETYRDKQQELEQQREQLLKQAKQEAESTRETLIKEAKQEVETLKNQWYERLETEKEAFLQELRQQANQQINLMTRHALEDLANASLEQLIITKFIDNLPRLTPVEAITSISSFNSASQPLTIRSNFPLSSEQQTELINALQEHFNQDIDIKFETISDLICGIEIRNHGYKIAWNLEQYLDELEQQMSQALNQIPVEGGNNNESRS